MALIGGDPPLRKTASTSGEEGALKLRALSARMKRIRVPSGDLTDFHRAKGSLADWLHFHLTDPA